MARNYQPTLIVLAGILYRYCTRWQTRLEEAMTPEQVVCLQALIAALAECLAVITNPPVE